MGIGLVQANLFSCPPVIKAGQELLKGEKHCSIKLSKGSLEKSRIFYLLIGHRYENHLPYPISVFFVDEQVIFGCSF